MDFTVKVELIGIFLILYENLDILSSPKKLDTKIDFTMKIFTPF